MSEISSGSSPVETLACRALRLRRYCIKLSPASTKDTSNIAAAVTNAANCTGLQHHMSQQDMARYSIGYVKACLALPSDWMLLLLVYQRGPAHRAYTCSATSWLPEPRHPYAASLASCCSACLLIATRAFQSLEDNSAMQGQGRAAHELSSGRMPDMTATVLDTTDGSLHSAPTMLHA